MRHTALGSVNARSSELFLADFLAENALNDGGTCEEHVGGVLHHDREVCEGRGVNRSTGAGTEYSRDLRHDTGGKDIPLEYLAISGQRIDTLLDPGSAGVIQADEGGTVTCRQIQNLAYFLGHGL